MFYDIDSMSKVPVTCNWVFSSNIINIKFSMVLMCFIFLLCVALHPIWIGKKHSNSRPISAELTHKLAFRFHKVFT